MNFYKLFNLVDGLIGDKATFKGLSFEVGHGIFIIDILTYGTDGDIMFICDFVPHNALEPISFAAKGVEELKDQISYYILQ